MDGGDSTKLNISLEPHLLEVLRPLTDLLPPLLADELKAYVHRDMIPYSTLLAISHWSRTPEGTEKLRAHSPPLNSSSYMMVSLLAGVKTSPERILGSYMPPPGPEELAAQQKRERQEITAILNALLSIVGVGFATWWAADQLHWSNQWRVLLALGSSLVVAIAESGLFIIWRSRQVASEARRSSRSKAHATMHKRVDDNGDEADETYVIVEPQLSEQSKSPAVNLRQRRLYVKQTTT